MLVKTLDNIESKWLLKTAAQTKKSGPHLQVREMLNELYPTLRILEEVEIEVKRAKTLYLDFYIPTYNIAIEIDGAHHRELVPFFSKNQVGFVGQQTNDSLKQKWCEFNNISFIRLQDNETKEDWLKNF